MAKYITFPAEITMLVGALVLLYLVYLYWGWPSRVTKCIKNNPNGGGDTQGARFMFVPLSALIIIYTALVLLIGKNDGSFDWQTPSTFFTAMLITAAVFFTAMKFFPPTFYASFINVAEFESMGFSSPRYQEMSVAKYELEALFFMIYNTGITSWDNYRITVDFGTEFEAFAQSDDFPSSKNWAWKTKDPRVMNNPCTVALQATNALVVGEGQTLRFLIRAKTAGIFKIGVHVVISGRPGGMQKYLRLNVIEQEKQ